MHEFESEQSLRVRIRFSFSFSFSCRFWECALSSASNHLCARLYKHSRCCLPSRQRPVVLLHIELLTIDVVGLRLHAHMCFSNVLPCCPGSFAIDNQLHDVVWGFLPCVTQFCMYEMCMENPHCRSRAEQSELRLMWNIGGPNLLDMASRSDRIRKLSLPTRL